MAARKIQNSDEFWLIGQGHVAFQLLWSALELKLFDVLSEGPLTRRNISERLGLQDYPCRVLCSGLTALGLIEQIKEGYKNTDFAAKNLKHGGLYHRILGWQYHIVYPGLSHLTTSLQQSKNVGLQLFKGEGQTLYERLQNNPHLESIFQEAMSALSTEARAGLLSQQIFVEHKHVTDIGGGDGTNSIQLLTQFPKLKFTVFDNFSVIQRAQKNIQKQHLEDKINFVAGNVLGSDALPKSDAYLMCHMVTIFSEHENTAIFKKCFDALPKGGRLFLYNMFTHDDGSGPVASSLGTPYFLAIATGKGFLYAVGEVQNWLETAGFSKVNVSQELNLNHRLIFAEK